MSTSFQRAVRAIRDNALFYLIGFIASLGLKYHYSKADSEGLCWMLTPVARLVALLSGIDFHWQLHAGYVSHSHGVVIAPACAGINFMVICFATLYFTLVARMQGTRAKCSWLVVSLVAAYLVTLCTNTVRIIISIYLYRAPIYGGWLTPERVHRLAGTLIFVTFLVAIFLAVERMMRRCRPSVTTGAAIAAPAQTRPCSVAGAVKFPLAWYGLITIIVPLLNGAARRNGSRFAEHTALVVLTALFAFLVWIVIAALFKKWVDILNKTKEKGENI